jgi:hypothetical protein
VPARTHHGAGHSPERAAARGQHEPTTAPGVRPKGRRPVASTNPPRRRAFARKGGGRCQHEPAGAGVRPKGGGPCEHGPGRARRSLMSASEWIAVPGVRGSALCQPEAVGTDRHGSPLQHFALTPRPRRDAPAVWRWGAELTPSSHGRSWAPPRAAPPAIQVVSHAPTPPRSALARKTLSTHSAEPQGCHSAPRTTLTCGRQPPATVSSFGVWPVAPQPRQAASACGRQPPSHAKQLRRAADNPKPPQTAPMFGRSARAPRPRGCAERSEVILRARTRQGAAIRL